MELDEILEGKQPTEVKEEQAEKPERVRDESGRFAKGEEVPEEKVKVEAEEPKPADPPAAPPAAQETIPTDPQASAFYAKAKDETAKRQRLEKELEQERQRAAEYARKVAEYEAKNAPDPLIDPEGRLKYERALLAQQAWDTKCALTKQYAQERHGADVVAEAESALLEAVKADPHLGRTVSSQADPYAYIVKWHKREKLLAEIGDDPDAYRQRLLTPAAPAQAEIQAPPRSLASATGARVSEPALAAEHKPLSSILGR